MGWFGKGIVLVVFVLLGAFFGGGWYCAGIVQVGHAMEPGLEDGARAFVNYKAFGGGGPGRGQLVLVKIPNEDGMVIRRVIGLPGETLEIAQSVLLINGQKVDEPWLIVTNAPPKVENPTPEFFPSTTIAPDTYFVLADGRKNFSDSRTFGAVKSDQILGRVWTLFGLTF